MKHLAKLGIYIVLGLSGLTSYHSAHAQVKYLTLAPLPDERGAVVTNQVVINEGYLEQYFKNIYRLGIVIATGLAVIMVMWGGIEYITTDAIGGKEEGKERIQNAFLGLLLALGSYIILRTIDPNLVNVRLDITAVDQRALSYLASRIILSEQDLVNVRAALATFMSTYNPATGTAADIPAGIPALNINGKLLTPTALANGQTTVIDGSRIALDTDGTQRPPFSDEDYQAQTAHQVNGKYLNAMTDPYVVLPAGSGVSLGTWVRLSNNTTGASTWAIAADVGPRYGEISVAAAQRLGYWNPGMGNYVASNPSNMTMTVYPNSK